MKIYRKYKPTKDTFNASTESSLDKLSLIDLAVVLKDSKGVSKIKEDMKNLIREKMRKGLI